MTKVRNSKKLLKKAKKIIPGVSQLLGKRPDMYLKDDNWPTYYSKAKGINIWGLNNKKYYDFSMMSAGTSVLGYSDNDVNRASIKAIKSGSISTLNPPEDVELAELLIKDHKWAGGVKFARCGGESMAIAVRLARAYTKKDNILFCGYHGWHDWYLAANHKSKKNLDFQLLPGLKPLGVPQGLKGTVIPFRFNNWEDVEKIIKKNISKAAAIVIEPCREGLPEKKYLIELKKIAKKNNSVLIFDEITSGWRLNSGGAHKLMNIDPDMVIYGKTIANGIPMSAILGKKEIMANALKTFVSSVFWTEKVGPASALAFIKKHKKLNVPKKLSHVGKSIKKIWNDAAKLNNLDIEISGIDPLASFKIKSKNWPALLTYFIQEMLKFNILTTDKCYASYKHDQGAINIYKKACYKVFKKISKIEKMGNILDKLEGPVKEMGFNRLTDFYNDRKK
jgi:glutamate-1-semialdehyde aminotransferase